MSSAGNQHSGEINRPITRQLYLWFYIIIMFMAVTFFQEQTSHTICIIRMQTQ